MTRGLRGDGDTAGTPAETDRATPWMATIVGRLTAYQTTEQATVIAFNIIYAMFPLALSLTAIGGYIFRGASARAQLFAEISRAFPDQIAREIAGAVSAAGNYSGLLGILGLATLLVFGSNLFTAIEMSFARVFNVTPRGLVHQRAVAFLIILTFCALLLFSIAAVHVAVLFGRLPGNLAARWYLSRVFGLAGGWTASTLMHLILYLVVPNVPLPLAAAWPGAVLAGTGTQITTLMFPLFIRYFGGFNWFGDAFALTFLVMTWAYILGFILIAGAEVNALRYAQLSRGRPCSAAPPRPDPPPR